VKPGRGFFIALSVGAWGGFYCHGRRVCLGWVAVTWRGVEMDDVIAAGLDRLEGRR
jgi:hypothetical protein